jgi:hypothetical protein
VPASVTTQSRIYGVHGCLVQFPSVHISRFWPGFFTSRLIGSNPCFSIRLSCESEHGLMRAVEANDLNVEVRPIWIGKDFITGHKINMAFLAARPKPNGPKGGGASGLHRVAYSSLHIQQAQNPNMARRNNTAKHKRAMLSDISEVLTFKLTQ